MAGGPTQAAAPIAPEGLLSLGQARDGCRVMLVVDGDESYRHALARALTQEGFAVESAQDCRKAPQLFSRIRPDLVLLDVVLLGQSGIELCQEMIRASRPVPVILVTAPNSEVDVVLGLELGASDYVVKPFRLRELAARMRAVLRRSVSAEEYQDAVLHLGPVRLDPNSRQVMVDHVPIVLSRKEFDLLALLMRRSGEVVTRDECMNELWRDRELINTRTLDTHVKRLRRKIESNPTNPCHLITVRSVGFRFQE